MTTNTPETQDAVIPNNIRTTQYQVFKGSAAARFQLERPREAYKVGCLFLQAAPLKGKVDGNNTYDWENKKISVKLGINDLSQIHYKLKVGERVELFHKFGDDNKIINFDPKEGGGYWLKIAESSNVDKTKKNSVSVPLSDEEVSTLVVLTFFAMPLIHNWL